MATKQHFLKQKQECLEINILAFRVHIYFSYNSFLSFLLHLIAVIHRILIALFLLHSFIPLNKDDF